MADLSQQTPNDLIAQGLLYQGHQAKMAYSPAFLRDAMPSSATKEEYAAFEAAAGNLASAKDAGDTAGMIGATRELMRVSRLAGGQDIVPNPAKFAKDVHVNTRMADVPAAYSSQMPETTDPDALAAAEAQIRQALAGDVQQAKAQQFAQQALRPSGAAGRPTDPGQLSSYELLQRGLAKQNRRP